MGSSLASKIRLKKIRNNGNNLIMNESIFKDIKFEIVSQSSSSKPIDDSLKTVLDFIIPIISLIAYLYYRLPNQNSKLSNKIQEKLKQLSGILIQTFSMNITSDNNNLSEMFQNIYTNLFFPNITKKEFLKKKWVIFDDNSPEHKRAFKNEDKTIFPRKNILLNSYIEIHT